MNDTIRVIAREEIKGVPTWYWILGIAFVLIAIATLLVFAKNNLKGYCVLTMVVTILGILYFLAMPFIEVHKYDKVWIEVGDYIRIEDFEHRYQILKRHGNLWEVKVIDNVDD